MNRREQVEGSSGHQGQTSEKRTEHTANTIVATDAVGRYQQLVDHSPYAIGLHQDGKLIFANRAALKLFGAEEMGQLVDRPIMELIHPQWRAAAQERIKRMLAGEEGLYPVEDLYLRIDGSAVPVEVTAAPIVIDDRPAIQVIALDISHRVDSENARKISEQRLLNALEKIPNAVVIYDKELRIVYVNDAAQHISGRSAADFIGKRDDEIWPPSVYQTYLPTLRQALHTKRPTRVETEVLLPATGRRHLDISCIPLLDDTGAVREVMGITQDHTAYKEAEQALNDSEVRYRAIVSNIPGGLLHVFDRDMRYVFNAGEELERLGLSNEALVGKSIHDVLPPEMAQRAEDAYRSVLAGETVRFEGGYGDAYFLVTASPQRDSDGEITGILVLSVNISERKQMEERLRLTQESMRRLSMQLIETQENERRFIAQELHDEIGQILTAAKTNITLLHLTNDADARTERLRDSLHTLDYALDQVRSLALDLRPSLLDDFGLAATLHWFCERLAERSGLQIMLTVDDALPPLPPVLETTCYRIAQAAMTNIERHAHASHIHLTLQTKANPKAETCGDTAKTVDPWLELIIYDNGQGFDVPAALINAVQGDSMGLLGMQERAHMMGGTLNVTSVIGEGTTIHTYLPIRDIK